MNMDVVIVDDDAVVLFLHKILIKKTFHTCDIHEFDNALKAMQFILQRKEGQKPLLVLLDINMPCMTGWQFLEELQKKTSSEEIYVTMVTSSINASDRKKAEQYPLVIDYLEKPLSKTVCSSLYEKLQQRS